MKYFIYYDNDKAKKKAVFQNTAFFSFSLQFTRPKPELYTHPRKSI